MKSKRKILFYYLNAFSHTGGIEKFNRCFIKALDELPEKFQSHIVSAYDAEKNTRYCTRSSFAGFGGRRIQSLLYILRCAFRYDTLILGHINLALAGVIIKFIYPRCKLILVAHGIEVWNKQYFIKRWCLQHADIILSVSNYTKNQLVLKNNIQPSRIKLFPNTIDPFFEIPTDFQKSKKLLARYELSTEHRVILTLSRLSSSERYKGYDKVIAALPLILEEIPNAVYILAGKYDRAEKERIESVIRVHSMEEYVKITGFIADEEVTGHYQLADVFIMPSRKEGFGIVFLEALACGTAVIGGNQDGTVEALRYGQLGTLINPAKINEIASSIVHQLSKTDLYSQRNQEEMLRLYKFSNYKDRLKEILA